MSKGKIEGAAKMRAAFAGMTAAFRGVSEAALAAAEANAKLNIAASWGKSVSDYARFGMDPSKRPSFTAISVSRPRESKEAGVTDIRIGPRSFVAALESLDSEERMRELMAPFAALAKERFVEFAQSMFGGTTTIQESVPVSGDTIVDNIRKAIADAAENGLLVQPPPDDHFIYGRYQPMALGREKMDRVGMYLHSYPLYAPRFPSALLHLDPGEPPSIRDRYTTDRAWKAVAMWLRAPVDRRRRKRALRILRQEMKR